MVCGGRNADSHYTRVAAGMVLMLLFLIMIMTMAAGAVHAMEPQPSQKTNATATFSGASLRMIDQAGVPIGNATLRLLCYEGPNATLPLSDRLYQSNIAGHLVQPLPEQCPFAAVLHILHRQPSGKPGRGDAYWVYNTSWEPGSRQLHATTGDIVIRDEWRLVLFELAIALEWTPPAADPYASELRAGFRLASGYLYDLTDGQMAFGPYNATTGGSTWESADIRVRAANDYRPTAQVGGMVPTAIRYMTPANQGPVFSSGEIWLGRNWDGFDGTDPINGAWTTVSGYRTLVHEWLHYALFLYDEYQSSNKTGRVVSYCTCADLPLVVDETTAGICAGVPAALAASAMAYHYSATELWHDGLPTTCTGSDQYFVHGEEDWATLSHWSAIQGLSTEWLRKPTEVSSGPQLGLAGDLFGRRPIPAPAAFALWLPLIQKNNPLPFATTSNEGVAVALSGMAYQGMAYQGMAYQGKGLLHTANITTNLQISPALSTGARFALHPQIYVQEIVTGTGSAQRFVHQGSTVGSRDARESIGQIPLLGVPDNALLHATADRYGPRETLRASYATTITGATVSTTISHTISDTISHTTSLEPNRWPANVDVLPGMDGPLLRALTVSVISRVPISVAPVMQLCPPDRGCSAYPSQALTMTANGTDSWRGRFRAPPNSELPHYAVLHVTVPGVGRVLRWIQMPGGVGPAHMDEHAPLRDGMVMVDATEALTQTNSRVLIMPAAVSDAISAPLPPGLSGVLEQALDIDIHLPTVVATANHDRQLTTPMILTLFHGQESLTRLAINRQQLHLLHFQRGSGRWQMVPPSGQSEALNWLATTPVTEDGIYAVGWSNIPNLGRFPALIADSGPISVTEPIRYQMLLPANPELAEPNDAFMAVGLPLGIEFADYLHCSSAQCFYDPARRVIQWQGLIEPGDLMIVSFDLILNVTPSTPCQSAVVLQGQFFDGLANQSSQAVTQINCPERAAR